MRRCLWLAACGTKSSVSMHSNDSRAITTVGACRAFPLVPGLGHGVSGSGCKSSFSCSGSRNSSSCPSSSASPKSLSISSGSAVKTPEYNVIVGRCRMGDGGTEQGLLLLLMGMGIGSWSSAMRFSAGSGSSCGS
ncbi:unnamed protein product [Mycena citricolor]|uniref:Uncharacterized protein n=1 Tax=Mycena citricolor TaxID=2018698 RepID=A0AAD2GTL8_9AGAR|nr:unnamed protein product [Mycena citricolor]